MINGDMILDLDIFSLIKNTTYKFNFDPRIFVFVNTSLSLDWSISNILIHHFERWYKKPEFEYNLIQSVVKYKRNYFNVVYIFA